MSIQNKSAQSNLGRGPRRVTVADVHREVPIGYNRAPQNSPPKVPLSVDRYPNRTTCLIPGSVRPTMTNGIWIRSAVLLQCNGQTDASTHRLTDRSRESLTTIARCATRATRPKKSTDARSTSKHNLPQHSVKDLAFYRKSAKLTPCDKTTKI